MTAKRFALMTATCLALLFPALGMAADAQGYDEAVVQYQNGRWADAYGRFIALANEGDADAARTALFMLRYGPQLYNAHWDAMPSEVARWEKLAASTQGRSSPVFQPVASR
ncbi:MAG TPA: hypothetical protein VGC80_04525 [Acetobacteraceae bacterium]|jgi:hypothetical protein